MAEHSDPIRFQVFVHWLAGHAESLIAARVGLKPSQVKGIIHRSPYRRRSNMTRDERQQCLDELRAVWIQGGVEVAGLVEDHFKALKLDAAQIKRRPATFSSIFAVGL